MLTFNLLKLRKASLTLIAVFLAFNVSAQKIITSEYDEFTDDKKVITSWERIATSLWFAPKVRLIQINNTAYINLKVQTEPKVVSVDVGDRFYIKFDDGTKMSLINEKYTISCRGCGATGIGGIEGQGVELTFVLTQEQLALLKNKTIEKVRLETSEGYMEATTKPKHAAKINNLVLLLQNEG